jgi:hypothetical protein
MERRGRRDCAGCRCMLESELEAVETLVGRMGLRGAKRSVRGWDWVVRRLYDGGWRRRRDQSHPGLLL